MDFVVTYEPDAHVVHAKISGALDLADMQATVDAVIACPGALPQDGILSDHTQIAAPITPPDLAALLVFLTLRADQLQHRRWAIVTASLASYGMMRALSVGAQRIPLDVDVFHSEAEARAWLSGSAASAT